MEKKALFNSLIKNICYLPEAVNLERFWLVTWNSGGSSRNAAHMHDQGQGGLVSCALKQIAYDQWAIMNYIFVLRRNRIHTWKCILSSLDKKKNGKNKNNIIHATYHRPKANLSHPTQYLK